MQTKTLELARERAAVSRTELLARAREDLGIERERLATASQLHSGFAVSSLTSVVTGLVADAVEQTWSDVREVLDGAGQAWFPGIERELSGLVEQSVPETFAKRLLEDSTRDIAGHDKDHMLAVLSRARRAALRRVTSDIDLFVHALHVKRQIRWYARPGIPAAIVSGVIGGAFVVIAALVTNLVQFADPGTDSSAVVQQSEPPPFRALVVPESVDLEQRLGFASITFDEAYMALIDTVSTDLAKSAFKERYTGSRVRWTARLVDASEDPFDLHEGPYMTAQLAPLGFPPPRSALHAWANLRDDQLQAFADVPRGAGVLLEGRLAFPEVSRYCESMQVRDAVLVDFWVP